MTHTTNNTISIQSSHNNYYLVIGNNTTQEVTSILIHKTQAKKWAKKLNLEIIDTTLKLFSNETIPNNT